MSSVPYGFSVTGFNHPELSFRETKVLLVWICSFMRTFVCSSSLSRSKWGTFVTPLPKCSSGVVSWPLWCPSWCAACCCCCALWVSRALGDECASAVAMDAPYGEEINEIQGSQAAFRTCFIPPESTKPPPFLLMVTPSVCPLFCIPGVIVCAGHVLCGQGGCYIFYERTFLHTSLIESALRWSQKAFFFFIAGEIPVHAKVLDRNNPLSPDIGTHIRSAISHCLKHILNFIVPWWAVIVWLHVVFHSSRRVLHKEPKSGTLLAENVASDGGDGVPDQRRDP